MSGTKIKAFLLHLYPELARFPLFKQITTTVIPNLTPRVRTALRYGLPVVTVTLVLVVGVRIGTFLLSLFRPSAVLPTPVTVVTPSPTSTYQSTFLPLSRTVQDFNPQLPDPLPPVFDEKISLEPLSE